MLVMPPSSMLLWWAAEGADLAGAALGQAQAQGALAANKAAILAKAAAMGAAQAQGTLALGRWVLLFGDDQVDAGAGSLALELAGLRHSAIVELFELDCTPIGGDQLFFHSGVSERMLPVVWQGVTYTPFPVMAEGFARSGDGPLARPTLRVMNIDGLVGALIRSYRRLKGAKLTRRRTLARYLDAVNFAGGNPQADPASTFPDDVFVLDRVVTRNAHVVEYACVSPLDVQGRKLPGRIMLHNVCKWRYRGPECGYAGPGVATANDTPTTVLALDKCSQRLSGCRLRQWPGNELPFEGFPGMGVLRNA